MNGAHTQAELMMDGLGERREVEPDRGTRDALRILKEQREKALDSMFSFCSTGRASGIKIIDHEVGDVPDGLRIIRAMEMLHAQSGNCGGRTVTALLGGHGREIGCAGDADARQGIAPKDM
jgi:hypothetical protein